MKETSAHPEPGALRVLILEDSAADAELIERQLRRAGIVFAARLVEEKAGFSKALAEFRPEVILSDFKLPAFDGMAALKLAHLQAPDTPFVFVSGSIGEEKAIETLAQGASDYIFKDNLARLGPAVKRVVEEARLRQEKKTTDQELRHHVEELRLISEAADHFVHINDLDKIYVYLTQTIRAISGADYLLLSLYNEEQQGLQPKVLEGVAPFQELLIRQLGRAPEQTILLLKDMSPAEFEDFISRKLLPSRDGLFTLTDRATPRSVCRLIEKAMGITAVYSMGFSWENQLFGGLALAFKKGKELRNGPTIEAVVNLAAVAIKRLLAEKSLSESKDQLLQSEEYYRTLVETSPDAIAIVDAGGRISFASQKTLELLAIPPRSSLKGISILDFVEPGEIPRVQARLVEILSGSSLPQVNEYRLRRRDRRPFWAEISSAPLRDGAGRSIGLLLVCRDVSERKHIEAERQALQEIMLGLASSESLQDFLKNVHQSIAKVITAENFFIVLYNKETALFEEAYSVDKFDTTPAPPASLEKSVSRYIFRSGKPLLLSQAVFDKLQAKGEVELVGTNSSSWLGVPLKTSRETIGVMVVQDYETKDRYSQRDLDFLVSISGQVALVVERKRVEAEILREKAFLEALVETAPQGIAITDNSGRIQRVNGEFVRMFGYKAGEAVGTNINDLVAPGEFQEEAWAITRATGAGETSFKETLRKRKDGSLLHVAVIGVPILIAGRQVAVYAIYSDISERKRAEEQIRSSLREKEVLLQEIHHRVKNNLQIISGLLTLQANQSAGKSLEDVFRESQDRIHTIALIHEKLYRSHNLAEIAFDDYLRSLTENLFSSHGIAVGRVTAGYDMEKILLTIEKAIPLGLIVNELLTNSLKHAFPGGRRGEIHIRLRGYGEAKSFALKTDSGTLHVVPTCELVVADDGIGLPAGFSLAQQKTLGMNLVSMLAKQLQAELKVKTGPGAEFRLVFSGLPNGEKSHGA